MEAAPHTKPSRLQRWFTARKTLGWYAAEVIVIFLGITASYLFDEWRQARKDRQAEAKLLQQFAAELTEKAEEIEGDTQDPFMDTLVYRFDSLQKVLLTQSRAYGPLLLTEEQAYYLVEYASQLKNYYLKLSTPAFEVADAGNLWVLLPDSVVSSLYGIGQTFVALGRNYNDMTQAASHFWVEGTTCFNRPLRVVAGKRMVEFTPEALTRLTIWVRNLKTFQNGGRFARNRFEVTVKQIAHRLTELGQN